MNPKIKKVIDEIERTKAKITELQILLPELERKRIDMENTEIIKLVRSAEILPAELPAFLESLKAPKASVSVSTVQHGSSHVAESETLAVSESAVIQQQNHHAPGDDYEQDDGDYSDDDYPDEDNDNEDSQSED